MITAVLTALGYRIRGGMFEQWGFRLPLCKWWFCTLWTFCCYHLNPVMGWQQIVSIFIGARLATAFCGWGEAVSCALGTRKPDPKEMNELDFDEFCDKFEWAEHKIFRWVIPAGKLIEHPQLYGIVWLTLRGVLLSYLIASPMNKISLMLAGAPMGLIYWFAGWLYRRGLKDGKNGWRTAEYLYGFYLGAVLELVQRYLKF